MKLASYRATGGSRVAIVFEAPYGRLVDVADAARWRESEPAEFVGLWEVQTMTDLLRLGPRGMQQVKELYEALLSAPDGKVVIESGLPLAETELDAPVPNPPKVVCIGINYADHAREAGMAVPDVPTIFSKFSTSVSGPRDGIPIPAASSHIDYEGELGFVLFDGPRGISRDDALTYVAGLTIINDVSARDYQFMTSQWLIGKAFDGFAPCGPYLVPLDREDLLTPRTLETFVNGELRQSARTDQLIFGLEELVTFMSRIWTFEAGDLVATGTPAGIGSTRQPPIFLTHGDRVQVRIEGLGELDNVVD